MEHELWLHKGKKFQRSGPDGLEAWGVAIAASFITFIMGGINRASGILYVEFIKEFQTDRMKASLPFTIRSLTRNLLGPIVGICGQKYGVRRIILMGSVIGTLSTVACFFLSDIFWISVFWGCLSGIGAAMIITLTQVAINEHFVKHISTASGIGLSGGCFGSFVFPAMFESLIEIYSVQGTFLFVAGMIMHVIPAAIIMKKPNWLKDPTRENNKIFVNEDISSDTAVKFKNSTVCNFGKEDNETELLERSDIISCEKSTINKNKCSSENDLHGTLCNKIDTDLLWTERDLVAPLLMNNTSTFPPPKFWQVQRFSEETQKEVVDVFCEISKYIHSDSSAFNHSVQSSSPSNINEKNVIEDKDMPCINEHSSFHPTETTNFNSNPVNFLLFLLENLFDRDKEAVIQLFPQDRHEALHKILHELKRIYFVLENNAHNCDKVTNYQPISNNLDSTQASAERSNTFCSHIKTAMWLHAKPLFLLTCLCRCVHFITFVPILTTVVDFSRDKGLPEEYGKYAIGTLALGDLIGRMFLGWLTDKKCLTLPRYMFIFMVLQGIFTIALAITNSVESLLPILTVYGLLQGCTFIQHPVLISRYMEKDEQSIAMGCLSFLPGILGFALPFYIGYFRDTVGSYNGIFYINGTIGSVIGCLWLAEPYLLKCSLRLPQRGQKIPV